MSSGTEVHTGSWSWRFQDGDNFFGNEQHSRSTTAADVRGVYSRFFILEWWYADQDGAGNITSQGTILFHGFPTRDTNNDDVINGQMYEIKSDGTIVATFTLKATRVY